ncbi:hypothetical protein HanPSC8_Chr10g0428831 [Helianthus annuus]|nr:hypothetical protein HanPSC8_Chr10g0428831 [Helianthus annuus]
MVLKAAPDLDGMGTSPIPHSLIKHIQSQWAYFDYNWAKSATYNNIYLLAKHGMSMLLLTSMWRLNNLKVIFIWDFV